MPKKPKSLREQAQKKVQAKLGFYTVLITFSFSSIVLLMLSFYLTDISFWLMLPIPFFVMVIGIMYISTFGYSTKDGPNTDWKEAEIEKEMRKLYQKQTEKHSDVEYASEEDQLELKALEQLKEKYRTDDLV